MDEFKQKIKGPEVREYCHTKPKRWVELAETTPSGKMLFACTSCGRISVTPDKTCYPLVSDLSPEEMRAVVDELKAKHEKDDGGN